MSNQKLLVSELCRFVWENRSISHPNSSHRCTKIGPHIQHRCECGMWLRNPHGLPITEEPVKPNLALPRLTLHDKLKAEMDRWLRECGPNFQWTTQDVLDFAEVVFRRLAEQGKEK
jgi:hypothetical protein